MAGDSGRESPATLFFKPLLRRGSLFALGPTLALLARAQQLALACGIAKSIIPVGSSIQNSLQNSQMTEPERNDFLTSSESMLSRIQGRLDAFDPDELEADLAGGVLRITFADRRTCILNRQAAASQIWMAEGASAWHFARDPISGAWLDTKGRGDLLVVLEEVLSRRLNRSIGKL